MTVGRVRDSREQSLRQNERLNLNTYTSRMRVFPKIWEVKKEGKNEKILRALRPFTPRRTFYGKLDQGDIE